MISVQSHNLQTGLARTLQDDLWRKFGRATIRHKVKAHLYLILAIASKVKI